MTRLARAFIAGGIVGAIGFIVCVTPLRRTLEDGLGLGLLFKLRGARPAPDEVVIVTIDRPSINRLQLPLRTHKWPRSLHARAIDRLQQANPAVIVVDILFTESGVPEQDQLLVEAVRSSANVVLVEYLLRDVSPVHGARGSAYGRLNIERAIPPFPALEKACLMSAPFPLPKIPVRLNNYWVFKPQAGDLPTLPAAAFQAFAQPVYHAFVKLAEMNGFDRQGLIPTQWQAVVEQKKLRKAMGAFQLFFRQRPDAAAEMLTKVGRTPLVGGDAAHERLLHALVNMYRRPHLRYLNFYGPPGSFRTLSYHRILRPSSDGGSPPPLPDLNGKAVFIGATDKLTQEQVDGFYTVFSQPDGRDISGVEIAATAFANILGDEPVRPLPFGGHLALILTWGLIMGLIGIWFPGPAAYCALATLSLLYGLTTYLLFATTSRWLPIAIPLFVQMPLAVGGALIWNYREANRKRLNMQTAFEYYLPDNMVAQLAEGLESIRHQQLVYGACLLTDAQNYTVIAENMAPQDLSRFVNRYLQVLFEPVRRNGGVISDVKGDSILAIWPAGGPETTIRRRACQAALEMDRAVSRFNNSEKDRGRALPTRIGVHAGYLSLGNVGAVDHFEYRPVGAAVNTAARLETMNKRLGTRILVSEEVIGQITDFLVRSLGRFLLAGSSKPVAVYELVAHTNDAGPQEHFVHARFARALEAFQHRDFDRALTGFHELAFGDVQDGPSSFYHGLCRHYRRNPPPTDWDGTVRMARK